MLQLTVAGRPAYAVEEAGTWYGCHAEPVPGDGDTQRIDRIRDVAPPPPRPARVERALDRV